MKYKLQHINIKLRSYLNDKGKVEGLWNKDCDSKGSFLSRLQHNNFFIR